MPTCVFQTIDVLRCVQHALGSTSWSMGFLEDETPTPALFFVHDQGVYVMSNGEPRDTRDATDENSRAYTVHAAGTNPDVDEDWWHNAAALVGGDDFAEVLPVTQQWLTDCAQYEEFYVTITENQLEAGFRKPRVRVAEPAGA